MELPPAGHLPAWTSTAAYSNSTTRLTTTTHTCQAGHESTLWPPVPLGQGTPEKIQSEVGPQVTCCVARCCSPDGPQGASIMQSATHQGESNPPLTIILKVRLLKASHKQQFLRSNITASPILFQDHWLRMSHISSFGRWYLFPWKVNLYVYF